VENGEIILTVADGGKGFDPGNVGDPLAPENRFKRDGRGIFYMKSFMDHVEYGFRPGGGTVLTLRKRIAAVTAGVRPYRRRTHESGSAEAGRDHGPGPEGQIHDRRG
jgi:hypothetical protein